MSASLSLYPYLLLDKSPTFILYYAILHYTILHYTMLYYTIAGVTEPVAIVL